MGVIVSTQQTLESLYREYPQYILKRGDEYWTKNKSFPLPLVIQRIAVISAAGSAGWQDFKHAVDNNPYGYKFEITPFFTRVQGESNAEAMQDALIAIYQSQVTFDIVAIIRGGGAQTDLLIFDHYLVGRVIAAFLHRSSPD